MVRQDRENLNDYEQRLQVYFRDIERALQELGSGDQKVPPEIYGWFLLNKHIRLEHSDVATLKSQTTTYKLEDVLQALRKMWGGESLVLKDQERKRTNHAAKTYLVDDDDDESEGNQTAWWNDQDEEEAPGPDEETEIWFEEALEALQEEPTDETVLANFQEAKKAFYKDARKALDQNRVNRGFYPQTKGKTKGGRKGKGDGKDSEFHGTCMRCGKWGHKAQFCPQQASRKGKGKGTGVGFVYTTWSLPETTDASSESIDNPTFMNVSEPVAKAIMDCGASESIIGAWTLQGIHDELNQLGFNPDAEISLDTTVRKSFVFGNNESSLALGQATMNAGIHGTEQLLDAHVVEGQTPLLLSSKWLYEQEAIIDFKKAQALLPKISSDVIQLERAPTYHLLLPVTAYPGHEKARAITAAVEDESPLLRACALMREKDNPAPAEAQE